ncbi:hypothetical protein SYK_12060 [Pseudodesulfovibrio nedwellii]|uniref:Uncharacterized protein n=1 Tax=Pseudodesulfovibrio nedwellii TaxID=2973072 RepID=A0ABM8AZW8_9BACT|nr:hypothetical protein [Pseudodesulfovibrio nedwellii]BDQ36846.1 hypothetical protein SYK_12060 [Pseudodesulfovibrio nedwellii]
MSKKKKKNVIRKTKKTMQKHAKGTSNVIQVALPDLMAGCKFTPPRSIPSNIEYYESVEGNRFMRTSILIPIDEFGCPQLNVFPDTIVCLAETMIDGICMESCPLALVEPTVNTIEPRYIVESWIPGLTQAHPDDLDA